MRRVSRWMSCVAAAGVFCSSGGRLDAQDLPASEVIKNRIANFREIGTAYKGITDELKKKDPYIPGIQESAQQVESLGSEILTWFPAGSGPTEEPEMGIIDAILSWFSSDDAAAEEGKTNAKPAVWTQRAAFEQSYRKFQAAAKKMHEVARSGDKAAVAVQAKALGDTCKGCHDTFREEIDE